MSKMTKENLWWPDITVNDTEIVTDGWPNCPNHEYALSQTKDHVYQTCRNCPRLLARKKSK